MTLQTYHFEGTPVRDVLVAGEPWFVGKDVCGVLGITNHNDALGSLPDDERKGVGIGDPLGRNEQEMICVNEPGLYRLIFKSRKAEAERFKRWVCHEVLPAIRRTGAYGTPGAAAGGYVVSVADHVALLNWKIAALERGVKPKVKRPPKVSEEEVARMRAMQAAGVELREIAIRCGRSLTWTTWLLAQPGAKAEEADHG